VKTSCANARTAVRVPVLLALAVLGGTLGCGPTSTDPSDLRVNVKVVNYSGLNPVSVEISWPSGSRSVTVPSPNDVNVEGIAANVDERIRFRPAFLAYSSVQAECIVGPDLTNGSGIYGQVDIAWTGATEVTAVCSGAGLPGGGWK